MAALIVWLAYLCCLLFGAQTYRIRPWLKQWLLQPVPNKVRERAISAE
jgi:hypothetical protein